MLGIVFWGRVFGKLVFWVSLESLCSGVSLESSGQVSTGACAWAALVP
jgi:hypothetical protein